MIIELMLLMIVLGAGIVFVAWSNTRRRRQDALERREVEDSTGKLKQELERTANEIIGRMENHVTHLENVLDESERNRTQLEGRVTELKKLLKKSEGQSGEIRDLLARLDDAGEEVNSMQRKMDVVERKLNFAMTTPLPVQQPVSIPQMPTPLVPPIITPPPIVPRTPAPAATVTTTPPEKINPLGPITVPPIIRPTNVAGKDFDKILEESIAETPKLEEPPPRKSIVLSPENKKPVAVVEADPVKIEATRKKLNEASAELAKTSAEESNANQAQGLQKKRRGSRSARDVRKAALEAIKAAEQSSPVAEKPQQKPPPEKELLPERRDLKLATTDSSVIKEMLLAGMSIEDISRETGLGRGAIELIQEMTRRQLNRR
ncbi:MAG: hypothetical protein IJL12_03165 [Selenomonadaceae bacterium]|nr:hypothetical protein [Selenomonadaceae bacterium]